MTIGKLELVLVMGSWIETGGDQERRFRTVSCYDKEEHLYGKLIEQR